MALDAVVVSGRRHKSVEVEETVSNRTKAVTFKILNVKAVLCIPGHLAETNIQAQTIEEPVRRKNLPPTPTEAVMERDAAAPDAFAVVHERSCIIQERSPL